MSSAVVNLFDEKDQGGGGGEGATTMIQEGDNLLGGFENVVYHEGDDEDRFVLVDESDDEAEDEDFVLTNNVAEEPKGGEKVDKKEEQDEEEEEESDVIATAGTKQLVFFISILIASYVLAINAMAGFCLLAKSLRVVDANMGRHHHDPVEKWNIPTVASSRPLQQSLSLMIPHPSRHVAITTSNAAMVMEKPEQYMMPSPAVAKSPISNRSVASPPEIDAFSYHRAVVEEESTFKQLANLQDPYVPSLDAAWPQPSPSPTSSTKRLAYPSLSSLISVVAGDIMIPVPPKIRPLHFPAMGGQIPYSPTLHIPSLAVDRVRNFWNWARDEPIEHASVVLEHKNNHNVTTATAVIRSPAVFPVPSFETPAIVKSELDTFLEQQGDRSLVLFYSSRNKSSPAVLQTWGELTDKVRSTLKVDCYVDKAVCRSHRITYVPTVVMVQNGQLGRELSYEADPFKMFTKYLMAVDALNAGPSIQSLRNKNRRRRRRTNAAVVALSQYSFRDFLTQHKHAVVVFDHVTGGDVDRQVWKHFAAALEQEGLNVVLATVDCHSNPKICLDQSIATIPTIRWFTDGVSSVPDFEKVLVKKKFIKYARRVLAGVA
jgi:hypothetical protein